MDRAIVTFHDPKSDQRIIVNLTHDSDNDTLDVQCKFTPIIDDKTQLGLIGYLSEIFLTSLNNETTDTTQSNCG